MEETHDLGTLLLIIILAVSGLGVFYYWDDLSSVSLETHLFAG